jgi:hypothetical protein
MTADQAAQRRGYAAQSELALRNRLEEFCRARWPVARVVHELVMGEGKVRADVVAVDIDHIAAFEIKGGFDDTTRLLHQVGMYQLCVPEVWMVVDQRHDHDAKLIRHLMPSIGLLVGTGFDRGWPKAPVEIISVAEAAPRPVVPEMMLRMLWRDELASACQRAGCYAATAKSTRRAMVAALLELSTEYLQALVCAELRGRDALWRADAPIKPGAAA